MSNPYLRATPPPKGQALLTRIPMYDFAGALEMEQDLLPEELCVARIANPRATGYTHNVALVYKDHEGRVYSCHLLQHHGELKDTPENHEIMAKAVAEQKALEKK